MTMITVVTTSQGKTSLMNALAGRAFYGETTGVIKINGTSMQMSALKSMAAFVPQDDIVHSTLTVEENITYAALFRTENPCVGVENRQDHIKVLVDEAINIFMLNHVRKTIVGDVEKRGISGGQRKRVSVAMEIVGEPLIIFLDEPTSGLDATSSEVRPGQGGLKPQLEQ